MRRALLALLVMLSPLPAIGGGKKPATTLFAVLAQGSSGLPSDHPGVAVAPIAIISGKEFRPPPEDYHESDEPLPPEARRFVHEHYGKGRRLHLYWGGLPAGTATIGQVWDAGCTGLFAKVRLDPALRIGGGVRALATNRALTPASLGSRRAASDVERRAALEAARQAFRRRGVQAAVARIRVGNLTVLESAIGARIVGDFSVSDGHARHSLFLVLAGDAGALRPELETVHRMTDLDEKDTEIESLVDWLDLDGDGVPELITQTDEYEGTWYAIYRLNGGAWERIYRGGDFGC